MMDPLLERILTELQGLRNEMKAGLQELRSEMREEMQELRSQMATKEELHALRNETREELKGLRSEVKEEMNKGFTEMKQLMMEYHLENITADEKLLEAISATNQRLDHHIQATREQFITHEHAIGILHRNQLKFETELEKLKSR